MHLDDDRLQRWIDGELTPEQRAAAELHLGDCRECRVRVAAAEAEDLELQALLATLDDPSPRLVPDVHHVIRRGRRPLFGLGRAAAILVALGAASAAWALPGSPLRSWVESLRETPPAPVPTLPAAAVPEAGIGVDPGPLLRVDVELRGGGVSGEVVIDDEALVRVEVVEGVVRFESDPARLRIVAEGGARLVVRVPRDAPRVEIRDGVGVVWRRVDGVVEVGTASRGAEGRWAWRSEGAR